MGKIVVEFVGGSMHGRTVEAVNADPSAAVKPISNLWSGAQLGPVGHHFYMSTGESQALEDLYEVVGRVGKPDEELVILAEYRPDPRD